MARFADDTDARGSALIAADGSNSMTLSLLLGEPGTLYALPARFIGVTAALPEDEMKPLRSINLLSFQGAHPDFMWFSVLSTPKTNGSLGAAQPLYEPQINLSWVVKRLEDKVPAAEADKLARVKEMARRAIEGIPDSTPVQEIKLADWPTMKWQGDGLVTLLGDTAHAMTMYCGEAAHYGFSDAINLEEQLKLWHSGLKTQEQTLEDYETEMR